MTEQINYLVTGGGVDHFGLLPGPSVQLWDVLNKWLTKTWQAEDAQTRERLRRINGCLDKLSASLLQVHRLRQFHDKLVSMARYVPNGATTAYRGAEACADFEALILQGRSALDRLTWYTSAEFRQSCSSFRRLEAVLENCSKSDARASAICKIIREADTRVTAIFAAVDDPLALRDLIGHKHSVLEGIATSFTLAAVPTNRVVAIDCTIDLPGLASPVALLQTTRAAAQTLPFIVLNTLAAMTGQSILPTESFEPTWTNKTVVFSEFETKEALGQPLGPHVMRVLGTFSPAGFDILTRNVSPSIYEKGIERQAGPKGWHNRKKRRK